MFWALCVLGHDCFSNNPKLNSVVGLLLHSSIVVPYHGRRISHRTHHQNHGHVENDESWHPLFEKIFRNLDGITRTLRFTAPFPMLAYPFYLVIVIILVEFGLVIEETIQVEQKSRENRFPFPPRQRLVRAK